MIDADQGKLVGFKGDMIHIFNKNEGAIHRSDYFLDLAHRENILLLGDSMGDLRMADGATNNKNLLKIGFLNDKVGLSLLKVHSHQRAITLTITYSHALHLTFNNPGLEINILRQWTTGPPSLRIWLSRKLFSN